MLSGCGTINRQVRDLNIETTLINCEYDKYVIENNNRLFNTNRKIEVLPQKIYTDRIKLEQTLKQVNVVIVNKTLDASGSGVTIKYKDGFYILSAGHMLDKLDDDLYLYENDNEICKLKVIKHSFVVLGNKTIEDLLLLKPVDDDIQPIFYTELADIEPFTGTEINIIGNPLGIEDVVTDGRIITYQRNFMYMTGTSYFGNSGGGVYNNEGKLVGIISHLSAAQPYPPELVYSPIDPLAPATIDPGVPAYMIHGAVRLAAILEFMEEVN
jgi:S1-C subfamily serine protease